MRPKKMTMAGTMPKRMPTPLRMANLPKLQRAVLLIPPMAMRTAAQTPLHRRRLSNTTKRLQTRAVVRDYADLDL
jgi:hypothetical protein